MKKNFLNHIKKIIVLSAIIALSAQSFLRFPVVTYSAGEVDSLDLVAIFVEKDIFADRGLAERVARYALDIQKTLPQTKAIVVPVEKDRHPFEVVKVLSNLYFEGEDLGNMRALLVGTVFVGQVPLPVVTKNDYNFVSMYPYTDFEESLYIWSDEKNAFIENNITGSPQPEIWHGVIRVPENYASDEVEYLNGFFDKNHAFHTGDPYYSTFDQNVFYADLFNEPEYLDPYFFKGYERFLQNLDDIAYNRYNKNWLEEVTKQAQEDMDTGYNFDDDGDGLIDEDKFDGLDNDGDKLIDEDGSDPLNDVRDASYNPFPGASTFGEALFGNASELYEQMPDIYSKIGIWNFMERYSDLMSYYNADVVNKVEGSGRWSRYDADTMLALISEKDEYTYYFLKDVDEYLEDEFMSLAKNLEEPYLILDGVATCEANYCNYFNGKPAGGGSDKLAQGLIESPRECSLTRGTPNEIGENSVASEQNRVFYPQTAGEESKKCDPFGGCCGNNYMNPEQCNPDDAIWPVSTDIVRFKENGLDGKVLKGDGTVELNSEAEVKTGSEKLLSFLECNEVNLKKCTADEDGETGRSSIATVDCNVCSMPRPCPPLVEPQYYYRQISSIVEHNDPTPEKLTAQYTDGLSIAMPIDEPRYISLNVTGTGGGLSRTSKLNENWKELWVFYPELLDTPRSFETYDNETVELVYDQLLADLAYLYNRAIVEKSVINNLPCVGVRCDYVNFIDGLNKYYNSLGEIAVAFKGDIAPARDVWKRGVDSAYQAGELPMTAPSYFDDVLKREFDADEIADALMWRNMTIDEKYEYVLDEYQSKNDTYIHHRDNGYELFSLTGTGNATEVYYGINPDVPDELEISSEELDKEIDELAAEVYAGNPCYNGEGVSTENYISGGVFCAFREAAKLEKIVQPIYGLGEEIPNDIDYDGVPDEMEEALGFDKYNHDSDGDGLPDGAEGRTRLNIYSDKNILKSDGVSYANVTVEVLNKNNEVLATDNWTKIKLIGSGSSDEVLEIVPSEVYVKKGVAEFRIYPKENTGRVVLYAEAEELTSKNIFLNFSDKYLETRVEVTEVEDEYTNDLTAGGESELQIGSAVFNKEGEVVDTGLMPRVHFIAEPEDMVEITENDVLAENGFAVTTIRAGKKAGRVKIYSQTLNNSAGAIADSDSVDLTVLPGDPATIKINPTVDVIPVSRGGEVPVKIEVYDEYGNLATKGFYTLTVTHEGVGSISASGGDIYPDEDGYQVAVYAGMATVYLNTDEAGTATISARGEGMSSVSTAVEVMEKASIEISLNELRPTVGGEVIKGSVRVLDSEGKILNEQISSVDLKTSDSSKLQIEGDGHVIAEDGKINFELKTGEVSGKVVLSATHPGFEPGVVVLDVKPLAAEKLIFLNSAHEKLRVNREDELEVMVAAVDKFKNINPDASGNVEFKITPATASFGSLDKTSATLRDGVATVNLKGSRESGRVDLIAENESLEKALPLSVDTVFVWDKEEILDSNPQDLYSLILGAPAGDVASDDYLGAYKLFAGKTQAVSSVTISPQLKTPLFKINTNGRVLPSVAASDPGVSVDANSFNTDPLKLILKEDGYRVGEVYYNLDENVRRGVVSGLKNIRDGVYLNPLGTYEAENNEGILTLFDSDGFKILSIREDGGVDFYDNTASLNLAEEQSPYGLVLDILHNGQLTGKILISLNEKEIKDYYFDEEIGNGITFRSNRTLLADYEVMIFPTEYSTAMSGETYYIVDNEREYGSVGSSFMTIESSPEYESMGFTEGPKHALLFAAGETAGNATKFYMGVSEILLGDPTISLPRKNSPSGLTGFTSDIGRMIFSDKDEDILNILKLDINNDDVDEILIVMENGEVRYFSNNFIGNNLSRTEELMRVSEKIVSAVAGDFTLNDKGIVFLSATGELIPYVLENNRFERRVIGDDWEDVHSVFAEDMDRDGVTDLVVGEMDGDMVIYYGDKENIFEGEKINLGRVGLLANPQENLTGSVAVYYEGMAGLTEEDYILGVNEVVPLPKSEELKSVDNTSATGALETYKEYISEEEYAEMKSFYDEYDSDEIEVYFEPNMTGSSGFDDEVEYRILTFAPDFQGSLKTIRNLSGRDEVSVGDTLEYTLELKNSSGRSIQNISTAHLGSYYYEIDTDSLVCENCGSDYELRNSEAGDYELVIDGIDLAAGETAKITYQVYVFAQPEITISAGYYEEGDYADEILDLTVVPDGNPGTGVLHYFSTGKREYIEQFITDPISLSRVPRSEKESNEIQNTQVAERKRSVLEEIQNFLLPIAQANGDGKPTFYYIGADYCPACKTTLPMMEKLASENPNVNFVPLDLNENAESAFVNNNNLMLNRTIPFAVLEEPNGDRKVYGDGSQYLQSDKFAKEIKSYSDSYQPPPPPPPVNTEPAEGIDFGYSGENPATFPPQSEYDSYMETWDNMSDIDYNLGETGGIDTFDSSNIDLSGGLNSSFESVYENSSSDNWDYNDVNANFDTGLGDYDDAYNQAVSDVDNFGSLSLGGGDTDGGGMSDGLDFGLDFNNTETDFGGGFEPDLSDAAENLNYSDTSNVTGSESYFGGGDTDGDGIPNGADSSQNPAGSGMSDGEAAADNLRNKTCNASGCSAGGQSSSGAAPVNQASNMPGYKTKDSKRAGKDPGKPLFWLPPPPLCTDWQKCSFLRFYFTITKTKQPATGICMGPYKKNMEWSTSPLKGNCFPATSLVPMPQFQQLMKLQNMMSAMSPMTCSLGSNLMAGKMGCMGGLGNLGVLGGLGGMLGGLGNIGGMIGKIGGLTNMLSNFGALKGALGDIGKITSLMQGFGGISNMLGNLGSISGVMKNIGDMGGLMSSLQSGFNMQALSGLMNTNGFSGLINNVGAMQNLSSLVGSVKGFDKLSNVQALLNNPSAESILSNADSLNNLTSLVGGSGLGDVLSKGNNMKAFLSSPNLGGICSSSASAQGLMSLMGDSKVASVLSNPAQLQGLVNAKGITDVLGNADMLGQAKGLISGSGVSGLLQGGLVGGRLGSVLSGAGNMSSLVSNGLSGLGMQGISSITNSVGLMTQCGAGTFNNISQLKKNFLIKGFPPLITQWFHKNILQIKNVLAGKLPSLGVNMANYKGDTETKKPCTTCTGVDDFMTKTGNMPYVELAVQRSQVDIPYLSPIELRKYEENILALEEMAKSQGIHGASDFMRSIQANKQALNSLKKFPQQLSDYTTDYRNYLGEVQGAVKQVISYHKNNIQKYEKQMGLWHKFGARIKSMLKGWQKYVNMATSFNSRSERCSNGRMDSTNWLLKHPALKGILPALPNLQFKKNPINIADVSKIPDKVEFAVPAIDFQPQRVILPDLSSYVAGDFNSNTTLPEMHAAGVLTPGSILPSLPKIPKLPKLPSLPSMELPSLPDLPVPPKIPKVLSGLMSAAKKVIMVMDIYRMMRQGALPPPEWGLKERVEVLSERSRLPLLGADAKNYSFNRLNTPQQFNACSGIMGSSIPTDISNFSQGNMGGILQRAMSPLNVFKNTSFDSSNYTLPTTSSGGSCSAGSCNLYTLPESAEIYQFEKDFLAYIENVSKDLEKDKDEYIDINELPDEFWLAWSGDTNARLDAEAEKSLQAAMQPNYEHVNNLIAMSDDLNNYSNSLDQMQYYADAWNDVSTAPPVALAGLEADSYLVSNNINNGKISSKPSGRYLAQAVTYTIPDEALGDLGDVPIETGDSLGDAPMYTDAPVITEDDVMGFFLIDQMGTAEIFSYYNDENSEETTLLFADYDNDSDDDLFYSIGGDLYVKENYTIIPEKKYLREDPEIKIFEELLPAHRVLNNIKTENDEFGQPSISFDQNEEESVGYELALCRSPERCQYINEVVPNAVVHLLPEEEISSPTYLGSARVFVFEGLAWLDTIGGEKLSLTVGDNISVTGGENIRTAAESKTDIYLPDGRVITLAPNTEIEVPNMNTSFLNFNVIAGEVYIANYINNLPYYPGEYFYTESGAKIIFEHENGSNLILEGNSVFAPTEKPSVLGYVKSSKKGILFGMSRKKAGSNSDFYLEPDAFIHARTALSLRAEGEDGAKMELNLKTHDTFQFDETVRIIIERGDAEILYPNEPYRLQELYAGTYLASGAMIDVYEDETVVYSRGIGELHLNAGQSFQLIETVNSDVISEDLYIDQGSWYGRMRSFDEIGRTGVWGEIFFIDGTDSISVPYLQKMTVPFGVKIPLGITIPEGANVAWDVDLKIDKDKDGDSENDWEYENMNEITVGPYDDTNVRKIRARITKDRKVEYQDFEITPVISDLSVGAVDIGGGVLRVSSDPALPGARAVIMKKEGGDYNVIKSFELNESGESIVSLSTDKVLKVLDSENETVLNLDSPYGIPKENVKVSVKQYKDEYAPRFVFGEGLGEVLYIPKNNLDVRVVDDDKLACENGEMEEVCIYAENEMIELVPLGGGNEVAPGGVEVRRNGETEAMITRMGKVYLLSDDISLQSYVSDDKPMRFRFTKNGLELASMVINPSGGVFDADSFGSDYPEDSVIVFADNVEIYRELEKDDNIVAGFINFETGEILSTSLPLIITE